MRTRLARVTGENLELMVAVAGKFADGNFSDAGKSRRFLRQAQDKVVHELDRSLNFDCDAGGCIPDRPGQIKFGGEPKDVRAESNSLHNSGNSDFPANLHKEPRMAMPPRASCLPAALPCSQRSHSANPSRVWQETRTISIPA